MNYIKNLAFAPEKQRVAGMGAGDIGDSMEGQKKPRCQ